MHPHTSAGRISHRRRLSLLRGGARREGSLPIPAVEQGWIIRHQFGQVEYASEHWFRWPPPRWPRTRSAGLATTAKSPAGRVRRVDLVAVHDTLALLVVLFREGMSSGRFQSLPAGADQAQLDRVASLLNVLSVDRTASEIAAALADLPAGGAHRRRGDPADGRRGAGPDDERIRRRPDRRSLQRRAAQRDGRPEFERSEKVRQVFSALENRAYLGSLVEEVAQADGVQIFISPSRKTGRWRCRTCLVLTPSGQIGQAIGVVGVLSTRFGCRMRRRSRRSSSCRAS